MCFAGGGERRSAAAALVLLSAVGIAATTEQLDVLPRVVVVLGYADGAYNYSSRSVYEGGGGGEAQVHSRNR